MKKVFKDKIINVDDKNDNKFLFDYISFWEENNNVEIVYLSELLEKRKNNNMLLKAKQKPAIYSNVYSPKDELEIFCYLFEKALKEKKKVHIIGITLKEELNIIEDYYKSIGFKREDVNCYEVDFKKALVTVSVKIENIMWKGSDYKRMGDKIFFNPPIRESGQVKAMYKGINKGIISNIYFKKLENEHKNFLEKLIKEEHLLGITLAKLLKYNLEDIGFKGKNSELVINYS
ncbi:hypothetical protein CSB08_00945 [Candidatus Gracilibacteria bacterium]|nr:MAG: hypothetical protein CSB08_00945 [Candidatus Gracilibacteria bacterium]